MKVILKNTSEQPIYEQIKQLLEQDNDNSIHKFIKLLINSYIMYIFHI